MWLFKIGPQKINQPGERQLTCHQISGIITVAAGEIPSIPLLDRERNPH